MEMETNTMVLVLLKGTHVHGFRGSKVFIVKGTFVSGLWVVWLSLKRESS